jgi:hypothetical protein
MVQMRRTAHNGNTDQSGMLPLKSPLRESNTMQKIPAANSLTGRLARAAGHPAHEPSPRAVEVTMSATEPAAALGRVPAKDRVAPDGDRCTASVISGQRCSRIAPKGQALCAGHTAMAGNGPTPTGKRQ